MLSICKYHHIKYISFRDSSIQLNVGQAMLKNFLSRSIAYYALHRLEYQNKLVSWVQGYLWYMTFFLSHSSIIPKSFSYVNETHFSKKKYSLILRISLHVASNAT